MESSDNLDAAEFIAGRLLPSILGDDELSTATLLAPDRLLEHAICRYYPDLDGEERQQLLFWVNYQMRYKIHEYAQARALPLLRRTLSKDACKRLRKDYGHVEIVGSAGGHYRIYAYGECCERVFEQNGRWYGGVRYCYHDPLRILCPADHSLAISLMLLANEPRFLAEANPSLWESSFRRPPKLVQEQARAVINEWKARREVIS